MKFGLATGLAVLGALLSLASGACTPDSEDKNPAPVLAKSCQEACADNSDCNVDFVCVAKRCTYSGAVEVPQCSDDNSCTPIVSGWLELAACDADHLCNFGECIVVEGAGRCVLPPPCTGTNQAISWPSVLGSEVTVCGIADYQCRNGSCWKACQPGDCGGERPVCASDGECHCDEQSCSGSTRGELCMDSGRCGCAADTDCSSDYADHCFDGVCGCSSVDICTGETLHVGTQWVCE